MTVRVADIEGTDVWTVVTGLAAGLESALETLSLGTLVSIVFSQHGITEDDTRPASGFAQREQGIRFFYEDTEGNKGNVTLPAADLGTYAVAGQDRVDLSDTDIAAMVTWLEANALSNHGNAITVNYGVIVGRSS
jgi:hypothetical protein